QSYSRTHLYLTQGNLNKGTREMASKESSQRQLNTKLVKLLLQEEPEESITTPTSDTAFSEGESREETKSSLSGKCRTCYRKMMLSSTARNLCDKSNSVLLYYIEIFTGVRVTDGLPHYICNECHENLKKAIEFRKNCQKTEALLKQTKEGAAKYRLVASDNEIESELENVLYEELAQKASETSSGAFSDEDYGSEMEFVALKDKVLLEEKDIPSTEEDFELKEKHKVRKSKRKSRHKCNNIASIVECATDEETGKANGEGKIYKVVLKEEEEGHSLKVPKLKRPKLSLEEKKLKSRERFRSKPLNFICDQCGNSFRMAAHLEMHMLRHNNTKNFQCSECSKKFYDAYQCNMHLRVRHRGEKPYTCNHCSESFGSASHRLRHERQVYSEAEKEELIMKDGRYLCNICPKSYTSKHSLGVHRNSHTGDKPFKCKTCDRGFTDPSSLRRHEGSHDKLPFHCEICLKGFLMSYQLKDHMLIHTGERPFKCELCDVFFRYKYNLNKHLNSSAHLKASQKTLMDDSEELQETTTDV
ncbi:hypothetical protein KR009_012222, partial [Drosophila setifemur]